MHFHAAKPSAHGQEAPRTSARCVESDSLLLPLQPGRIASVKQQAHHLQQLQQHGSPIPLKKQGTLNGNNQRTSERAHATTIKQEPIDYLRLRRTEESARAILRNRTQHVVVHEILQPSSSVDVAPSLNDKPSPTKASIMDQQDAVRHMDEVLAEMSQRVLNHKPQKLSDSSSSSAAVLASQLQQLYRQQSQAEKESKAAAQRVQQTLTAVRNDISLMYKFTPLFKIYTRHKCKSAWHHWLQYVNWHRDEQARLALLWPHAVTIQRVFRSKRERWQRARDRMAIAWSQWTGCITIQRCARVWLGRRERQRLAESRQAIKLQAAWRGRRDRKWVKKVLQDQLRSMLRSFTPTGSLHRLNEVIHKNPELARPLNAMLSLIEETHVAVDTSTVYMAKNTRIAAKNASKLVEATRKQLFHAVFELSALIIKREQAVQDAKDVYISKQLAKQRLQQAHDNSIKAKKLLAAREKIAAENENDKMKAEEMWMREYLRMLRTADTDLVLRMKLDARRREEAENAHMVVEEYHTRYLVSEIRRRRHDDERRLGEVAKRHQFLLEQEQQQTQQLMELLKTNEMKQNEFQNKRDQSKAEKDEIWSKMSKEQQDEALRRLQLKQQLEEEEKARMDAKIHAQQAEERERNRRREESRKAKQEELARELAARDGMGQEDKRSRKVHFEFKKALHSETWKAKREKEAVKYSLDPMHYAKIQVMKELEERERKERYLMKKEDEMVEAIHEKERKAKYFEACRQRRMKEMADAKRAMKERVLMEIDDTLASEMRAVERRAEEYKATLVQMESLAQQEEQKRTRQLLEAKGRALMHDEEMRQRRMDLALKTHLEAKESHERQLMAHEELHRRAFDARMAKKAQKRFRKTCIFQMMKEDVASMERHDWEEEGHRLEALLWASEDIAALSNVIKEYPTFLATNVSIMKDLGGFHGVAPPLPLDYEAVERHRYDELSLSLDQVPRKKRKTRKFFYHEFFEDDPILVKYKPQIQAPETSRIKARERWRQIAHHFFGKTRTVEAVRVAHLQLSEHKYLQAIDSFLEAIRLNATQPTPVGLVRQVARCYLKQWGATWQRTWLEKSLFYYHKAGSHVGMLTNPAFLQEIAGVLEKLGRFREAAEVLSGIISCFPRYAKLNEVIFRGGVVMISLQMYQQSREYLLHTLDMKPFGYEQHEILFLAARVMQLEGKPRRKLCAVAYEEAFRTNKREAYYRLYPTWKEWIKNVATWREIGDRYYAKKEFILARDAYQVMMKRIMKHSNSTTAHGVKTRHQVIEARRLSTLGNGNVVADEMEDGDWLRIARCASILGDRPTAATSMKRWLTRKPYEERVIEQFYTWPLARWKLLGVEVPERVIDALARKKRGAEAAEQAKLRAIQEKRHMVLRQRSVKAKERMIAWPEQEAAAAASPDVAESPQQHEHTANTQDICPADRTVVPQQQDHTTSTQEISAPLPDRVGMWMQVVDAATQEVYYWDEETGDISWDPPVPKS